MGSPSRPRDSSSPSNSALGLRILLIEDNEDIRDALVVVLESDGYEVTATQTAEDALQLLEVNAYHLVITDYALPGKTGGWLLKEARRRELMKQAVALVVTAHPDPRDVEGVKIVHKPLDVDDFLSEVYALLAPARAAELEREKERLEGGGPAANGGHKVELVLYVSSHSPSSLKATRNMSRLMQTYPPGNIHFTVHDLSTGALDPAVQDRIAYTPTLVRRSPGPRTWVLGDLEDIQIVIDLIASAGLEPKK